MYIEIIDKGECLSTTMEYYNGVYANKDEWAKYNFYPQNGMVGEIIKRTNTGAYLVKILEGIYVPMTRNGLREISSAEYNRRKASNACIGLDARQAKINEQFDDVCDLLWHNWRCLPDLRDSFKSDIISNIQRLTCDFLRNIFLPDLERSCVIYATDMCLEFKLKAGYLSPVVIEDVARQVTDVYQSLFANQFHQESKDRCYRELKCLVDNPEARSIIDKYYRDINNRYGWT